MKMIKEIKFLPNEIIIEEEKKGLFGTKQKTNNINIQTIRQLERQIEDNELLCIAIHYGDFDMYFIQSNQYDGDLEMIYEKVLNYRKDNSFEVVSTDLTSGSPEITVILEKD